MKAIATVAAVACAMAGGAACWAQPTPLPQFDFTKPEVVASWRPQHDVVRLEATPAGMVVEISGPDPYVAGPPVDLPEGSPLWLKVRMKADEPGTGQIFYYRHGTAPSEEQSVRFAAAGTDWQEHRLPVPPLGPRTCFRIDPPGTGGRATVAYLAFELRPTVAPPQWPKPVGPSGGQPMFTVTGGDVEVRHGRGGLGDFEVRVAGEPMAAGLRPTLLGYLADGGPRWISLAGASVAPATGEVGIDASLRDGDGGTWTIRQRFTPGDDGVAVEVAVTVDRPRDLVFLPLVLLSAGAGTFGTEKGQALLAGLEYLENEPSSSEADVRGPASRRQVPDALKLTMPLAAVQARGLYVGLVWEAGRDLAVVFDSPDRMLGSGGHLVGLICPGSDGHNRQEGSLLPHGALRLEAGRPVVARATIIGSRGQTVVPAVERYVRMRGLPPVPDARPDWPGYVRLAAGGWLDSQIRDGPLYRHAAWQGFRPQRAADAAFMMEYLAVMGADAALAARLRDAAAAAIAQVPPADYLSACVSHVRVPVAPLVYGHVAEALERARASARGQLKRFEPDGSLLYRKPADGPDYGSTHFAREANGLTANYVRAVLDGAVYSGDAELVKEGLRLLRAMDKFAGTVPRGAQTWECPLHTPDILAAAHMVHCYTLGYELTGDKALLDQARYWAWTGVPFVYLVNPTSGQVGPYSTIAVLGATNWVAPVWMGLPVQWCGLVYADALRRLARHDAARPWGRLADGITAAGIQHTWKTTDVRRQGLLPDSYRLREQQPDGPPINPGTVQANAPALYRRTPMYGFCSLRTAGILVHAPGEIGDAAETERGARFRVRGWPAGPYYVLVSGLRGAPAVKVDGKDRHIGDDAQYLPTGNLILRVTGEATIDLRLP